MLPTRRTAGSGSAGSCGPASAIPTVQFTLGDARGAGQPSYPVSLQKLDTPYHLRLQPVGDTLLLSATSRPNAGAAGSSEWANLVGIPGAVVDNSGPKDVPLLAGPKKGTFRIQVLFKAPTQCGSSCKGRAEIRNRTGVCAAACLASGAKKLPGDGPIVIGTRGTFTVPGTKKIRFYLTVTKAALLRTPFHTEGGFRVGDTRLRVYLTTRSGTVLAVRDGHIKVSIARIKSGALPGLTGILCSTVRDVPVRGGEIALGQLLQFAGLVDTGGQAKQLLLSDEVLVNDEPEGRRGRKLHEGDIVEVTGQELIRIVRRRGGLSGPTRTRAMREALERLARFPLLDGAVRPSLAALPARRRDPRRAARLPLGARGDAALGARAEPRPERDGRHDRLALRDHAARALRARTSRTTPAARRAARSRRRPASTRPSCSSRTTPARTSSRPATRGRSSIPPWRS